MIDYDYSEIIHGFLVVGVEGGGGSEVFVSPDSGTGVVGGAG